MLSHREFTLTPLLLVGALAACGSTEESAPHEPVPAPRTYALELAPLPVAPGSEGIVCIDTPGPDHDVFVTGWHAESRFAHHINVVTRTTGTPFATATPCDAAGAFGEYFFSMIGDTVDNRFDSTPERADVHFKLAKGASLVWELHYLNTSTAPVEAGAALTFFEAASADGREIRRLNFSGGTKMSIAPGTEQTLSFSCPGRSTNSEVLALSSHAHAHDDLVTLSFGNDAVYRSTDWEAPTQMQFDSLVVPSGVPGVWTCHVRNTLPTALTWGSKVQTKEMCIVYGFVLGEEWRCALP